MPVGDIYELAVFTQLSDQSGVNVLHYQVTAATPPEPGPTIIASQVSTTLAPLYRDLLSAFAEYRGLSAQKIRPLPSGAKGTSTSGAGPGELAGDPLPKQTSALISKRTALGGRRNRGRTYVPFPPESDNTGAAAPSVGYVVILQNLANQIAQVQVVADAGGSITLSPAIFSRVLPETITLITNAIASTRWATQRRRGDFGRPNLPPL